MTLPRRTFLAASAAVTAAEAQSPPRLGRIAAATIGAPDVDAVVAPYEKLFGYRVVERIAVDAALAASWGAPATAGRRSVTLQPPGGEAAFVRVVEIEPKPGFKAITTLGWNSIELAAMDPDAIHAQMQGSVFRIVGAPAQLGAFPTVRAMQAVGPAEEVVHLTSESGSSVFVPKTTTPVGRPFIVVLAAPDVAAATDWYASRFALKKNAVRRGPIGTINGAQGLAADHPHDATFLALAEHASFLELWGFDGAASVARPRAAGHLPQGVALASFTVASLAEFDLPWLAPPAARTGAIYRNQRSATFVGPAGELVELIEET